MRLSYFIRASEFVSLYIAKSKVTFNDFDRILLGITFRHIEIYNNVHMLLYITVNKILGH